MKPKARTILNSLFKWDLTRFHYPEPTPPLQIRIRYAKEDEFAAVADLWRRGISQEEGSPWKHFLRRWTPRTVERWFRHYHGKYGARTLVADKDGKIVGVGGPIFEIKSGVGTIFAGVVVAREERRQGIGSMLLYMALREIKDMGCWYATVETLHDITASRHLYVKFGGVETVRGKKSKSRSKKRRSKRREGP